MNGQWLNAVRAWGNAALSLVYPEWCQFCSAAPAPAAAGFVCANCQATIRPVEPPFCGRCGLPFAGDITTPFECANCRDMELHFESARAAVESHGVVRQAILRYKYQRALWLEPFLAGLLVRAAGPVLAARQPVWVVPVPLHPLKEREREFNQSARLAAPLAAALKIPLNTRLLRRVSFTVTQTRLSRSERARNMREVFALAPGTRLHGQGVVLVDDVFTTGATTNACAKALRDAGAGPVWVWTVARGI